MTLTLRAAALAACTAIALPLAAGAAIIQPGFITSISAGNSYTGGFSIGGGSSTIFSFRASGPLVIGGLAVSGTGNNGGSDVGAVRVTSPGGTSTLADLDNDGIITTADGRSGSVDGTIDGPFTFEDGDEFDVVFANNSGGDVSGTLSFEAEVSEGMAPVPLPAAGGLLGLGLLGMGAAARRRKA